MINYKHILVTSDLSPESDFLGARAATLAEALGAQLSIVHVIEHTPMVYGSGEFAIPVDLDIEETLEKEARKSLEKQAEKLHISKTNQWVIVGSRKDEIVKLAHDTNADLIIVGAHDKHGLALLLGSTADSILHALPCDVLCIKVDND